MVTALFHVLCRLSVQNNALTPQNEQFSGIKRGIIGETLNTNDLKAVAKKNGASVNDTIMAMLAVSLYKYFESKGKPEDTVTIGLPASFKKAAKTADQLKLINDLCPLFIELTLTEDFNKALKSVKRSGKELRNSFRPYALYYLTKIMAKVPMSVYLGISQHCTKKMTMTLSNVAGPKTPLVYEGIECRKMAILPPVIGLVPCGFSIISIGENVKIGF